MCRDRREPAARDHRRRQGPSDAWGGERFSPRCLRRAPRVDYGLNRTSATALAARAGRDDDQQASAAVRSDGDAAVGVGERVHGCPAATRLTRLRNTDGWNLLVEERFNVGLWRLATQLHRVVATDLRFAQLRRPSRDKGLDEALD